MLTFAKIFRNIIEGQEYKPSIIAFGRADWAMSVEEHDGKVIRKVIQEKRLLYINLWFVEIKHEWVVNVNRPPLKKVYDYKVTALSKFGRTVPTENSNDK